MTRPEASPYATVMDDSQLTGRPIVVAGAGPYGGDLEVAEPLVTGNKRWADVDRDICMPAEQFPTRRWWLAFGVALSMLSLLVLSLATLFYAGMGIVGVNAPVGWGTFIINFVFWIGIGHAGTLISAVLYLFRQQWRTGINRAAEAMTLFAVACAGVFPVIHLGRPWFAYWLVPHPNARGPSGSTSTRRWRGTSSRSPPTARCRWCSGTWACCRTWRPCATAPRTRGDAGSTTR
ncbi:MAG: NrfD/PsrC family molybdoenzyme membrane anchor subunit [Vicinamibacterales bacterium]